MAGRGRGMTLPAWMTEQQAARAPSPPQTHQQHGYGGGGNYGGYASTSYSSAPHNGNDGRYDNSSYDPYGSNSAPVVPPPAPVAGHASSYPQNYSDEKHRSKNRSRSRDRDYDSRNHRKRSPDRNSKRERSRSREKRRDRSVSPNDGKKWVSKRKGKSSNFDVRPAEGQVLPPIVGLGSNLNPAVKLAPDGSIIVGHNGSLANFQMTRHARRLYVGGIPPTATEEEIAHFFRTIITQSGYSRDSDPIASVFINREKAFAFVELQSIELTTACCKLDGLTYSGSSLRIRRPNDYIPEKVPHDLGPIPNLSLTALGVVSTSVPDGPNKVFIGGIPHELSEEDIKELLTAFGPLKAFHLVKEPGSNVSKGYAFCEYANPSHTNFAIEGLNNLPVCEKMLTVKLASQNITNPAVGGGGGGNAGIYGPSSGGGGGSVGGGYGGSGGYGQAKPEYSNQTPTRVLLLKNLVDKSELQDDHEYYDILDDVKNECSQYGSVKMVIIPRGKDGYPQSTEGSVFVEFADVESAKRASQSLKGRKFADRMVLADYFDEIKFSNRVLI